MDIVYCFHVPVLWIQPLCVKSAHPQNPGLWLLLLNASFVCNKTSLICDLFTDVRADLLCITETWLGLEGRIPFFQNMSSWNLRPGVVMWQLSSESQLKISGTLRQIARSETLFIKLGGRDNLGLLLLYWFLCCLNCLSPLLGDCWVSSGVL